MKQTNKQDRPAVLCSCGCSLQHHMNHKTHKIGECQQCGLDHSTGIPSFKCRAWNPQRVTVKKLKKTLRSEGLL